MSTGKNIPLPPFPELKQQSAHTCHTLTHHFKWFCCHNTKQSIWKEKHMEPQGRVKCFTHAAAYGFRPFYFFLSLKDSQLLSWAEWLSDLADLFLTCCGLPTTALWRGSIVSLTSLTKEVSQTTKSPSFELNSVLKPVMENHYFVFSVVRFVTVQAVVVLFS